MKIFTLNRGLIAFLLVFAVASQAQQEQSQRASAAEVGFDGAMTPAEIMTVLTEEALANDPDAHVEFVISIPSVAEGAVNSDELSGLPIKGQSGDSAIAQDGAQVRSMTVSIPFTANDYIQDGGFDSNRLLSEADAILSRLASPRQASGKGGMRTQSPLDSPNCGGYPQGTTVTVTTTSCAGTTQKTFTCSASGGGQNDWIVTSQDFFPAENSCINP